jgi:hypothetical protein
MKGDHIKSYWGNEKGPEKWLWDKVSAGTKEAQRTEEKLFQAIDKLSDEDLSSLLINMMFFYLVDHGETQFYKISTEVPLGWLGVKIELEKEEVEEGEQEGAFNEQS